MGDSMWIISHAPISATWLSRPCCYFAIRRKDWLAAARLDTTTPGTWNGSIVCLTRFGRLLFEPKLAAGRSLLCDVYRQLTRNEAALVADRLHFARIIVVTVD